MILTLILEDDDGQKVERNINPLVESTEQMICGWEGLDLIVSDMVDTLENSKKPL